MSLPPGIMQMALGAMGASAAGGSPGPINLGLLVKLPPCAVCLYRGPDDLVADAETMVDGTLVCAGHARELIGHMPRYRGYSE